MHAAQLLPLLAGTQCTQCGYPSCAAYADAIVGQGAAPNLCRPGGERVTIALQSALGLPSTGQPAQTPLPPQIAYITEPDCIGCTLCLQKCPTSAIVGATKQLHTVLPSLCTGCNLCVPVCPTACISLTPAPMRHQLTEQMPNGSITPAAATATWQLVNATIARQQSPHSRIPKAAGLPDTPTSHNPAILTPDILAKIAAARSKTTAKYAAKGPIRRPRALTKPKE